MEPKQTTDTEPTPPVTRTILSRTTLGPAHLTAAVEIRRIAIAPGQAAGAHVHNGPVFGSIESGSAVYQIAGEAESVLRPGDVFYEPEATTIDRFDATEEGVTFLAYFLLTAGQDPTIEFVEDPA